MLPGRDRISGDEHEDLCAWSVDLETQKVRVAMLPSALVELQTQSIKCNTGHLLLLKATAHDCVLIVMNIHMPKSKITSFQRQNCKRFKETKRDKRKTFKISLSVQDKVT